MRPYISSDAEATREVLRQAIELTAPSAYKARQIQA
jgi:hypothetical protein|tara:strand:+ start:1581 stop:1688 length:108 start_codon:yes stop_codon:yes gene_type:complete